MTEQYKPGREELVYVQLRKAGAFRDIPWGYYVGVSASRVIISAPTMEELFQQTKESRAIKDESFFVRKRGHPPMRVDIPTVFLEEDA